MAHNFYRPEAPSGENLVVDQELEALRESGHEVSLMERRSDEISSWSVAKRAALPATVIWGERARREIVSRMKDFRPDLVHVHNTFPLLSSSILYACRDAGVPVVTTLHNYKLACASGDFFRAGSVCHDCRQGDVRPALVHGCYRGSRLATAPVAAGMKLHRRAWTTLVSAHIFISDSQRDLLAPLGFPPERGFVKHNFVPEPTAVDKDASAHLVACVGRLDEAKGSRLMMRAWDAFRRRCPSSTLTLLIAGGGPLHEEVATWARRHQSVVMAGMVTRQEVSTIMRQARAALVPSEWEETFGMVAVEAMAAGTAPIAPARGSFPELIRAGLDGGLFEAGSAEAVADLLVDVDQHPEVWRERGISARDSYCRRFRRDAVIDRLLEIYRFAVENPVHGRTPDRVT